MLEREMEDLIATYPDEFFPRHGFTLEGRQGTFAKYGRYDLLFRDGFGKRILMELKALPARYEDANQLARYYEALRANKDEIVWMWLVAPSIPRAVREFLDQVGIQYSEIHDSEFREIAAKYGYIFAGETKLAVVHESSVVAKTRMNTSALRSQSVSLGSSNWFFNTDEGQLEGRGAWVKMLANSCIALWYPENINKNPEQMLARPAAGERVFFFLNKVGFIATALFTEEPPVPDRVVFPKGTSRAFLRRIANLVEVAHGKELKPREVMELGSKLNYIGPFYQIKDLQLADKILREILARADGRSPDVNSIQT